MSLPDPEEGHLDSSLSVSVHPRLQSHSYTPTRFSSHSSLGPISPSFPLSHSPDDPPVSSAFVFSSRRISVPVLGLRSTSTFPPDGTPSIHTSSPSLSTSCVIRPDRPDPHSSVVGSPSVFTPCGGFRCPLTGPSGFLRELMKILPVFCVHQSPSPLDLFKLSLPSHLDPQNHLLTLSLPRVFVLKNRPSRSLLPCLQDSQGVLPSELHD